MAMRLIQVRAGGGSPKTPPEGIERGASRPPIMNPSAGSVDPVDPLDDAALDVPGLDAVLAQERHGPGRCARRSCTGGGSRAPAAFSTISAEPPADLPERNQGRAGDAADLELVRLAHVEQEHRRAATSAARSAPGRSLRHAAGLPSSPPPLRRDAAELIVVDQLASPSGGRRTPGTPDRAAASARGSACSRRRRAAAGRPASSPPPSSSLIASVAWIVPITPGSTPSTPPSAQLGTRPGGGGSG